MLRASQAADLVALVPRPLKFRQLRVGSIGRSGCQRAAARSRLVAPASASIRGRAGRPGAGACRHSS